jgi:predicted dehydrogenase
MEEVTVVNPQMAATAVAVPVRCMDTSTPVKTNMDMLNLNDAIFHIALVIHDCHVTDRAITAIANPISFCKVSSLVVLNSRPMAETEDQKDVDAQARDWLQLYQVQRPEEVNVKYGDQGFRELLKSTVDAIYVIVPTESQQSYGISVLESGKHILISDPASTSFDSFRDQLECARKVGKFIQFSTTFVHHHRVKTFMDCVLRENFGSIESIDAKLTVNFQDVERVGVNLPLQEGDGCIRRLGRYCVLISTLLLARVGSRPVSARVIKFKRTPEGEPLSADCVVHFSGNIVSSFHVAYSAAPTRQVIEVRAHENYATMSDFVIPHPDGLSTYRIYQKAMDPITGKLEVVRGQAVDVPSGPQQDVMMWRQFRELSRSVDQEGWHAIEGQVRELTNVALQTKRIMNTLMESFGQDFSEVPIEIEDCRV